ncbi:MAG TPA: alpha/beta fold hydrolase [Candidatus Limnocylindria bacterium]|nr:alpha/beta fold hydrolase [Candidatus Limnocylindria bacterium]
MERLDLGVNGIRLHSRAEGKGQLVLLLHGFPETSYAWRGQIPALAGRFRVVAPDLRGYGESEKPPHVLNYRSTALVGDVAALIKALGEERAHVVGHDWGGFIGWLLAQRRPELVDRLAILNAPHPARFERAVRSFSRQLLRSWYVLFFQLPLVPEALLLRGGAEAIGRLLSGSAVRRTAFSADDLLEYRRAFSLPGAATATINYYRAAFRDTLTRRSAPSATVIRAPTLLIWGEHDRALGTELTHDMEGLFAGDFRVEYVRGAGHFVMEERPELVNRLLVDFLSA